MVALTKMPLIWLTCIPLITGLAMVETADMVLVSGYILEIFRLSSIILSTQVHISTTRILCTTTDWSEYSHLFLQQLVSHGQEGNGEAAAEEQDEVSSQLVSKNRNRIIKERMETNTSLSIPPGPHSMQ